jgi:hypothetical protein
MHKLIYHCSFRCVCTSCLWVLFQGPNHVALGLQAARPGRQRDCTRCRRTDPLGRQVKEKTPFVLTRVSSLSWHADSRSSWRANYTVGACVSVLRRLTPSVIEALTEAQKKVRKCGISPHENRHHMPRQARDKQTQEKLPLKTFLI